MNYNNVLKKRDKKKVIDEKLKEIEKLGDDSNLISPIIKVVLGLMVIEKHGSKRLKKKVLGGLD